MRFGRVRELWIYSKKACMSYASKINVEGSLCILFSKIYAPYQIFTFNHKFFNINYFIRKHRDISNSLGEGDSFHLPPISL